jgi:STE24 endopeptidase
VRSSAACHSMKDRLLTYNLVPRLGFLLSLSLVLAGTSLPAFAMRGSLARAIIVPALASDIAGTKSSLTTVNTKQSAVQQLNPPVSERDSEKIGRERASKNEYKTGAYTLPSALREKARRYSRIQYAIYFGGVALELVIYLALWLSGFGAWLRNLAARFFNHLFLQCLIFVPIFWVLVRILQFSLDFYSGYVVEHRFDLSTQSFPSWLADWGKALGLTILVAIFAVWILYRVIRRSPRRWWLIFWLITLPLALFVMFIEPWVVEPLFYKYTLLERTHPALTTRIEEMIHRAGIDIPKSRIFEMSASAKTRTLNAYVSGIGRSKRVVVWDNTLHELSPDEILSVLAHETGHYALHHGLKEFALDELVALGWFFVGFLAAAAAVRRWGPKTGMENLGDLAGFPLLMLILTAILFLASPIYCGISRYYEHQADQYGLELTYGILPDPNESAVRSFEILGKKDLSDPAPNPFIRFWLFTHPPLAERIRFAEHYKPWAEGKPMQLLHRPKQ